VSLAPAENLARSSCWRRLATSSSKRFDVQALEELSASLLPDTVRSGEPGACARAHRGSTWARESRASGAHDRRPPRRSGCSSAGSRRRCRFLGAERDSTIDTRNRRFMLPEPLRLASARHRPMYQGRFTCLRARTVSRAVGGIG
jgi:hypothetical protein